MVAVVFLVAPTATVRTMVEPFLATTLPEERALAIDRTGDPSGLTLWLAQEVKLSLLPVRFCPS